MIRSHPLLGAILAVATVVATAFAASGAPGDEAEPLEQRARTLSSEGRDAAADSLWQRGYAIRAAREPREDDAIPLAGLADTRRRLRRFADADSLSRLALEWARAADSPDAKLVSALYETRANLYAERRNADSALVEVDRALAWNERVAPPDSVSRARLTSVRGRALFSGGRTAEAIQHFQRAAAIQERHLGPVSADLGETMYRLGMAYSEIGDYVMGLRSAERSVQVREQVFGREHTLVAVSYMGLGGARRDLGDNAGALVAYGEAERILRAADPPNPAALATVLSNKGSVHLILGEGAKARASYEETIALRDQVFGPGRGEDLFVSGRVAMALLLENKAAEARERVERALAKSTRVDPLVTPGTLAIHASVAYRLGDRAAARASLERSYALTDSLRGSGSPRTLETLGQLAALDYAEGERADAFRRATAIEERGRLYLAQTADVLAEREALDWAAIRETGLTVLVALAADSIGLEAEQRRAVHDAIIRSRVLVLDRRAEERRAVGAGDLSLAGLVTELESARSELARLLVAAARDEAPLPADIDAARARRERAERALGTASAAYRDAHTRAEGGIEQVAPALRAGWALVSFVRMPPPAVELVDMAARRPEAARYAAFVLRAGETAPRAVDLGTAGRIEPAVARWVEALATRPAPATAAAAERRAASLGRAVRKLVWEPLAPALAGIDTVAWVPDGALHRMDLAALPGTAEGHYLVEQKLLLVRLTAERDLIPTRDEAPHAGARGLVAFGAVDFEASADGGTSLAMDASATRASPKLRFKPLPGTGREIESIARTWRASSTEPASLYAGATAQEDVVKREAPHARVLHLATHAFALGSTDTSDAIASEFVSRGVGGVAVSTKPADARPQEGPLLVPGLALAGVNRPAAHDAEDGFLTAEEIAALDLRGVEWTVLSACETGVADPSAVEAVQGLHRAFRRAGVGTVLLSLWSVDDASTAAWMDALYRARLEKGLATPAAVQSAHREVLAARRKARESTHPFWWAAFIASGRTD